MEKENDEIKKTVQKNYSDLLKIKDDSSSCCGTKPGSNVLNITGYTKDQLDSIPLDMGNTSFGCGNPTALAGLKEGEIVLDIGSGAGMDSILAAQKVGPSGKVIGLDMTPAMIEKARENIKMSGFTNVEIRQGDMEDMPLEDSSIDIIISNCVINLAPDKKKVFQEAYRVLKKGGRVSISDIVTHDLPGELRKNKTAWSSCLGGAIEEEEYISFMKEAGFQKIKVDSRYTFDPDSLIDYFGCCVSESSELDLLHKWKKDLAGNVSSIKISAFK